MSRWLALACYVAVVYSTLPVGPRIGLRLLRTAPGGWLLGPGLPALAIAGAALLALRVRRRRGPAWAWAAVATAAVGYTVAFSWLRAQHLERTHLPEYGVMAWLAWRALAPLVPGAPGYVAAAALASAIGWGDELLQRVVPGRVYDLRDVAMNAAGAVLGVVVIAAMRAGSPRQKPVAEPANAEIATGSLTG
jgi:hypothetical protein